MATDDPSLYDEVSKNYPDYEILTDKEGSLAAKVYKTRFTLEGLIGAMIDMHLLSKTNRLYCMHVQFKYGPTSLQINSN